MRKLIYRVNVPAFIGIDIAAESHEQARRIAKAILLAPVEPLFQEFQPDPANRMNMSLWTDDDLATERIEVVDSNEPKTPAALAVIETAHSDLAALAGNEEELIAATGGAK